MNCPLCTGVMVRGNTHILIENGVDSIIVINKVPALRCEQCGMEWIDDPTAEVLEKIVNELRQKGSIVEVQEFSKIAS